MKKIILLAAVASLTLASCAKERTCSCTYNNTAVTTVGGNSTTTTSTSTDKYTKERDTKKNFRRNELCTNWETSNTQNFGSATVVQTVKATCEVE